MNPAEPKPTGKATCPPHLNKEAKKEWRRISQELNRMGLLTSVDRMALAAYCTLWARWVAAEAKIELLGLVVKTDKGNAIQNPYVGVANRALDLLHKFASEFGLTPSSRSRLHVEGKPEKSKFGEFLSRVNSDDDATDEESEAPQSIN